ncbi:MAG: GspH/FimT family pseudopilin [Candidatus Endonucleobacter sp. (ex Gigantidas childressi)]|nr:GspH/FimT family pseudopilin [Candidatus Endonucleobacter sp. (ex Gigantidas childressi)]
MFESSENTSFLFGEIMDLYHEKGFTLPELVVTFTVAIILLSLAAPSMKSMLADRRIVMATEQIYKSIVLTRSEAVKRGLFVSLCRATNASQCAGSGEDWASGWIIFTDENRNGNIDDADQIIRVQPVLSSSISIIWNRGRYLRFNSRGMAIDAGTFTLCGTITDGDAMRTVSISVTGRARVAELESCDG